MATPLLTLEHVPLLRGPLLGPPDPEEGGGRGRHHPQTRPPAHQVDAATAQPTEGRRGLARGVPHQHGGVGGAGRQQQFALERE